MITPRQFHQQLTWQNQAEAVRLHRRVPPRVRGHVHRLGRGLDLAPIPALIHDPARVLVPHLGRPPVLALVPDQYLPRLLLLEVEKVLVAAAPLPRGRGLPFSVFLYVEFWFSCQSLLLLIHRDLFCFYEM